MEKANHVAAQRFWRTLADDVSLEAAQGRLDTWWPATATPGSGPPPGGLGTAPTRSAMSTC